MSEKTRPHREGCEWCDYFSEKSNDFDVPRAMLIGDSITNGYGKRVSNLCRIGADENGKGGRTVIAVDRMVSSFGISDPMLRSIVRMALCECGLDYGVVHFNCGLHGAEKPDAYEQALRGTVEDILRYQPQAKLILTTSTHITPAGGRSDVIDPASNKHVIDRNNAVRKVAAEYSLEIDDLWEVTAGNPEFAHTDGVHFGGECYDKLAERVKGILCGALGIGDEAFDAEV